MKVDTRGRELERNGKNEIEIFMEMGDLMPDFKRLILDVLTEDEVNDICGRYDGFYRYAKTLETIAVEIACGALKF
ncbi:MAG: hypothetical protein Q8L64_00030 [bacterium]|nr:hypothetical protein [bacterium]